MDFSSSCDKVKDSVVNVLACIDTTPISSGTGTIIGDGNIVITCAHCIMDNTKIVARFSGKNNGFEGQVKMINRDIDIAIIEFPQKIGTAVRLKDSNTVKIGNEAFVVGFPNNIDKITALSANIAGFENGGNIELIRIDCSVNHGNSGGPLFNAEGELVGVINAKHGSLSNFLKQVQNAKSGGVMMSIGGIDPIRTIQQLIKEMQNNLNLGIGYAIPINIIKQFEEFKELVK